MSKLIEQNQNGNPENYNYAFYCPGCKCHHGIKTTGNHPRWDFNGDMDKPTVKPSILINYDKNKRCHLFVTNGEIQYLNDCTHSLAGQTIEMQEED